MTNLVTEWRNRNTVDRTLAAAVREMNAALGKNYTSSRVKEWQDGKASPSMDVIKYMLPQVLPDVIAQYGLSKDDSSQLNQKILDLFPSA